MLRGRALESFAERHRMPLLHIADLVNYRRAIHAINPGASAGEPIQRLPAHAAPVPRA
jgi:hypothetical protein